MLNRKIQNEEILIRKAKPDLEEGLVFAQLFDEASEGFFKSMLGNKTHDILADAFVKTNNEYSFENVSIIEYKNKIAGMVSGYILAEKQGFTKNVLSQFPHGAKRQILMFSLMGKILSRFLGPKGQEDYYLQSIAVNSELRGKGLGQKLLKYSTDVAIYKGCKTLSLDVSSKNKKAIISYNRFGMKTKSHWPNIKIIPPVFTRMLKEL
jgi:ribosomal protein S18 acetylase RimI-like enzyme